MMLCVGMLAISPERGERMAAIVWAELAEILEGMTSDQARELLGDPPSEQARYRPTD
jgi:outer membrane protein assembly factor BamE (lipoprotein component of BamABCDE complex)